MNKITVGGKSWVVPPAVFLEASGYNCPCTPASEGATLEDLALSSSNPLICYLHSITGSVARQTAYSLKLNEDKSK